MGYFKDFSKSYFDMLDEVDKKVSQYAKEIINNHLRDIILLLDECETPIEQLLGLAIEENIKSMGIAIEPGCALLPQFEVMCGDKKYRVDFMLVVGPIPYCGNECLHLAIECDGHEFHEKTKEQAIRDKQRDRTLMAAGYNVMHFTGSEIWKDPNKCAREVIDYALKLWKEKSNY